MCTFRVLLLHQADCKCVFNTAVEWMQKLEESKGGECFPNNSSIYGDACSLGELLITM